MSDTTAAARQERFRERQRQAGKVEFRAWLTPDQVSVIRAYLLTGTLPTVPAPAGPVPVSVTFADKPRYEAREFLKRLGLSWDGQRWIGQVDNRTTAEELASSLRQMGGQVTIG